MATAIFPFAAHQIGAIYGKGANIPLPVVFALLLLVTGPCEEIYWRGFLQRQLMLRYGHRRGWLAATAIGNYGVALVGIFWNKVQLWIFWGILVVACLLAASFIFSILKRLEKATGS